MVRIQLFFSTIAPNRANREAVFEGSLIWYNSAYTCLTLVHKIRIAFSFLAGNMQKPGDLPGNGLSAATASTLYMPVRIHR